MIKATRLFTVSLSAAATAKLKTHAPETLPKSEGKFVKAWCYDRRGPIAKVLKLKSVNLIVQKPGDKGSEVTIKMTKVPLHRSDSSIINGRALGQIKKKNSGVGNGFSSPASSSLNESFFIGGSEGVGIVVKGTGKTDKGTTTSASSVAGTVDNTLKEGDLVWVYPPFVPSSTPPFSSHTNGNVKNVGCWVNGEFTVNPLYCYKIKNPKHEGIATYASRLMLAQALLLKTEAFANGITPRNKASSNNNNNNNNSGGSSGNNIARVDGKRGDVVVQNGGSNIVSLAVAKLARLMDIPVYTAAANARSATTTTTSSSSGGKDSNTKSSSTGRFSSASARHKLIDKDSKLYTYDVAGRRQMQRDIYEGNKSGKSLKRVTLFLNGVGGPYFNEFCKLLATPSSLSSPRVHGESVRSTEGAGGLNSSETAIISYGAESGPGISWAPSTLLYRNVTMCGISLQAIMYEYNKIITRDNFSRGAEGVDLSLKNALTNHHNSMQSQLDYVLSAIYGDFDDSSSGKFTYPVEESAGIETLPQLWDRLYIKGGGVKGVIKI